MEDDIEADIYLYGDIGWDVEAKEIVDYLNEHKGVDAINVHINSFGGDVSDGLAIYNSLKNSKIHIRTIVDGFACSAASLIFMAGDERLMNKSSMLMIHNAWTACFGNANEMRKTADDLEKINSTIVTAYMEHVLISEDELQKLLDEETWLDYDDCLTYGFSTHTYEKEKDESDLLNKLAQPIEAKVEEEIQDTEGIQTKKVSAIDLCTFLNTNFKE